MTVKMNAAEEEEFEYEDAAILNSFHTWAGITRVVLAILLRIGHVLIQVGSVPVNNVNLILLQNVVDVCWVTVVYVVIGFLIAQSDGASAFIGRGYWVGHTQADKDEAIIGWSAIVIASAICTSAIVGRTHTIGYLVIGFLLSAVVQPILVHSVWAPNGWMAGNILHNNATNGFRDYAGATVVHLTGGYSGLIGCMVLGRRILRLRDIDDASISPGSSATVFAGQLLVFLGLQSLSIPNYETEEEKILLRSLSWIYLNNLLAASSCCLFVVALHFLPSKEAFNHWTVVRCVQATVSGTVLVSAGTNVYTPQAAIILGCVGGLIFFLISRQVFHSALEDYCNIVATHLVCGILGTILMPLCSITRDTNLTSFFASFTWQLICLFAASGFIVTVMTIAFVLLECFGILRNRSEHLNHARALIALERGPRRLCLQRLFTPDSNSVYLQPGSLSKFGHRPGVGSWLWKYQQEIDSIGRNRVNELGQAGSSSNT